MFGIIVDTFGDMRDEQFRRDEIVENTCLVCLNEKKDILESKNEFDDHIDHQHNIWNYVYFLNYLKHKSFKDLSMSEMEAWESTRKKLHDWLPLKKSIFLKKIRLDEDDQEDEMMINLLTELNQKSKKLEDTLNATHHKVEVVSSGVMMVQQNLTNQAVLNSQNQLTNGNALAVAHMEAERNEEATENDTVSKISMETIRSDRHNDLKKISKGAQK